MSEYKELLKQLRPKYRKQLKGKMKAAQKKGVNTTIEMKARKKR